MTEAWADQREGDGLRQLLLERLEEPGPGDRWLAEEVARLAAEGAPVHAEILHILTHLRFPEGAARAHWERILSHRERLQRDLVRDVGLRVTILDYFVNVDRALRSPKVIELRAFAEAERSAITDPLTGLGNRAYFGAALEREVERARRLQQELSLVLLDLDDFKQINDGWGHPEGDRVLTGVGEAVRSELRGMDMAARYGGEEFAVLLPGTGRAGARAVADRIRARIESRFRGRAPHVTTSGGLATWPGDAGSAEELVRSADRALYRAKAMGKNGIADSGEERRRAPRLPARHSVVVSARGGGKARARARNTSDGGVLVRLRQPLAVGTQLDMVFEPPLGEHPDAAGEVVHVEAASDEPRWDVGVRLVARAG
jgi:diguanylate cyclase (GGDEF)-like protein